MKRLWLIPFLFSALAHGQMLQAVVGQQAAAVVGGSPTVQQVCVQGAYTSTSVTCTFTPHGVGDILVWYARGDSGGSTVPTVPTGCATWSAVTQGTTNGTESLALGTATTASSCTVTTTISSAGTYLEESIADTTGTIATVDGTPAFSYALTYGTPWSGPSTTTSSTGDLVLAFDETEYTVLTTLTVSSPFTTPTPNTPQGNWSGAVGYYVQPAAGAITPAWNYSNGSNGDNLATIAIKHS